MIMTEDKMSPQMSPQMSLASPHLSVHFFSSEDQARRVQERGNEAGLYCHISTIYLHCCPARHVHTRVTQIYHKEWIKTPSGRLSGPFTQIDSYKMFFSPLLKWKSGQIIAKTSHSKLLACHSPAIQHLLCGLINSRKYNNKNVVEQNVCKATRISKTVQTCLQTPGNLQDFRFAAKIHSESEPSMAAAERTNHHKRREANVQM